MTTDSPVDAALDRRQRLRERLRAEWIAEAEVEWRRRTGRPMVNHAGRPTRHHNRPLSA